MNVGDKLYEVRRDMHDDGRLTVVEYEIARLTPSFVWLKRTMIGDRICKHQVQGPRHDRSRLLSRYSGTPRDAILAARMQYGAKYDEAHATFKRWRECIEWCDNQLRDPT